MLRYTRQLITYLKSHIRFKIILPYAVLTLLVAIAGVYLSVSLVAGPLEQRFEGELIEAGRVVANGMAQRERLHLTIFRSVAFTEGIDQAILHNDHDKLAALVFPIAANSSIDRIDVISTDGRQLLEIHRPPGATSVEDYKTSAGADLTTWPVYPIIQKVLDGVVEFGRDKYVALATVEGNRLFLTAGPVKQGDQIVGAVLVSSYTEELLNSLVQLTSAEINLYDLQGNLINTTFPNSPETRSALAIAPDEARLLLVIEGEASRQRSTRLGGHEYDLLFGVFQARGEPLGFYSVAKETSFVESITTIRNLMALTFAFALVLVFGIGYMTANTITGRVQHLMENAMAVASGDFSRRSQIASDDEIGLLSRSLNHMTERLATKIFELTALHESSTAMTGKSGPNLDHALQALTASVRGVIQDTNQVVVYLLDKTGQVLAPRTLAAPGGRVFPALDFSQEGGMRSLLAIAKPQVISSADIEAFTLDGSFSANGASDLLIAPLIAGQETIGLLTITSKAPHSQSKFLDEDSQRLLGTLANQAAITIKNAQLFEATQQAYEELRQLDDLKTEFINIAAHELRTPLGGIILAANFIEKRGNPKLQKKAHAVIVSALRMRTMVDAMLTIQRLDAGTAFLRSTTLDIREILKKVISDFQPMAELEEHLITVNLPDTLPPLQADPEKVGLILSNLLSNAIKFTPAGGRIEVSAKDYIKGVLISVRDNGVGISPKDQEHIFDRFYQVRAEHMAGHGGIGLGLTIVKHLVELHEGQVWVESEPGKGATFFFTLPRKEEIDDVASSPKTNAYRQNPKEKLLKMTQ